MNEGSGQTVRDWSGRGNNGYLGSTAATDDNDPQWIDGVFRDSALRFFGDDYVTIPSSSSLKPQSLTVGAWVRFDSGALGGEVPGIFKYPLSMGGDGCNVSSYGFVTTVEEGLQFYIASNGRYIVSPATPRAIWDGKWHHIAGTFDGRAVRFYVDGKQVGNGSAVPAGTTIDYSLETTSGTIGGYAGECPGRQLNLRGDVDGVQVWSTPIQVDTVWAILKSVVSLAR